MKNMIKVPTGWTVNQMLKASVLSVALTLTACGGGGGSDATLVQQINSLIATGTPANLETAMDLLLSNQDNLSAADFEALQDAIASA